MTTPKKTNRPMTKKQALEIAIEAVKSARQRVAFDASVADQYGINNPHALKCEQRRDDFNEALKILGIMKQDSTFY
jgi:hypothetical protein